MHYHSRGQESIIEKIIYLFSKLPGLGPRSARRVVLHLLQDPEIRLKSLLTLLSEAAEQITKCNECGNIDIISPCNICNDHKRINHTIAVVESVADLWAIERSGFFTGKYHVLGGTVSTLTTGGDPLRLAQLMSKVKERNVEELIVATNSTLDGQTTAFYLTEYFKEVNILVSRLASGIPMGGELEYLDEGTLGAAFSLRKPLE